MKMDTETRDRLLSIGFPILLLLLWEFAVRVNWLDWRFFPAPSAVLVALWDMTAKGDLFGKLWLLPGLITQGDWNGVGTVVSEGH